MICCEDPAHYGLREAVAGLSSAFTAVKKSLEASTRNLNAQDNLFSVREPDATALSSLQAPWPAPGAKPIHTPELNQGGH